MHCYYFFFTETKGVLFVRILCKMMIIDWRLPALDVSLLSIGFIYIFYITSQLFYSFHDSWKFA